MKGFEISAKPKTNQKDGDSVIPHQAPATKPNKNTAFVFNEQMIMFVFPSQIIIHGGFQTCSGGLPPPQ